VLVNWREYGLGGRIVVRFRRHFGHDLRLAVISRQGRVIVEADVGKFKREPRSFPIRKDGDLVSERMEGKTLWVVVRRRDKRHEVGLDCFCFP